MFSSCNHFLESAAHYYYTAVVSDMFSYSCPSHRRYRVCDARTPGWDKGVLFAAGESNRLRSRSDITTSKDCRAIWRHDHRWSRRGTDKQSVEKRGELALHRRIENRWRVLF